MDADEAVNNPRGGTVKVSSESRQIVVNGTTLTHGVSHALPIPKKVMETNDHCIVSKRSVERNYYAQPHFYRHFVTKPKKRTALINRGYWLRMQTVERNLKKFLANVETCHKAVILNLGCGLDTLPFRMLAAEPHLCRNATFVDVDYPDLVAKKCTTIGDTPELKGLLNKAAEIHDDGKVLLKSENYVAIGCDLTDIADLTHKIESTVGYDDCIYFVIAEVSTTYMSPETADAIVSWAADFPCNVHFCLLEQFLPNGQSHPFASTMLSHFKNCGGALHVLEKYRTLEDQSNRFRNLGWIDIRVESLWDIWTDRTNSRLFTEDELAALTSVEPFDEWEEFALFANHYFCLTAKNAASISQVESSPPLVTYKNIDYKSLSTSTSKQGQSLSRTGGILYKSSAHVYDYHGGEDSKGRQSSTKSYINATMDHQPKKPPQLNISARKYHSITKLNDRLDYLLVGGRNKPQEPLQDCWLRLNGIWIVTDEVPKPLYRHSAACISPPDENSLVLVFGGISTNTETSNDWFVWHKGLGWSVVEVVGDRVSPCFGANLVALQPHRGILSGGMLEHGAVNNIVFFWTFTISNSRPRILVRNSKFNPDPFCRFGASVVAVSPKRYFLIGGIQSSGLVPESREVMKVDVEHVKQDEMSLKATELPGYRSLPVNITRPLLTGHSAIHDGKGICIAGGGSVCFSFGSHMNTDILRIDDDGNAETGVWKPLEWDSQVPARQTLPSKPRKSAQLPFRSLLSDNFIKFIPVSVVGIKGEDSLQKQIAKGRPCIFRSVDLGPCSAKWTIEYLKQAIGTVKKVDIHHALDDTMRFESKNFVIEKETFSEFIDAISKGEKRYLRAMNQDNKRKPASFSQDFEAIADDFRLPPQLKMAEDRMHSSVLRISGPINMWLHYDCLENILCQIQGRKRLVLFSPNDIAHLEIPPGRSSSDLDAFEPDSWSSTSLKNTHPYEVYLEPGDVLFLPPLWAHTALPLDGVSIAINIFFKALDEHCYVVGKDTYGNKDVREYDEARSDIHKAAKRFERMPPDMRRFYLTRLAGELLDQAR